VLALVEIPLSHFGSAERAPSCTFPKTVSTKEGVCWTSIDCGNTEIGRSNLQSLLSFQLICWVQPKGVEIEKGGVAFRVETRAWKIGRNEKHRRGRA